MILSLCWKGYAGTDRALASLAQATGLSRHLSFSQTDPDSTEIRFFLDYLKQQKPACLIVGAWTPAYEPFLKRLRRGGTRFAFYWTSSAGQVDISQEAPLLASLLADRRFSHRLFSSRELAQALPDHLRARFLPVTLGAPRAAVEARAQPTGLARLTLFCSPAEYRRKNVFNSLLAVAQLDPPVRLLLNGLSRAPGYSELLRTLKLDYDDPGQMPEESYRDAIVSADLGLQLSFADSFNQVAAQHLLSAVPVLGSAMVPVLEALSPDLRQLFILNEADAPTRWAGRLSELLSDRSALFQAGQRARQCLLEAHQSWAQEARNVLAELA